jgi:hypothetical protein
MKKVNNWEKLTSLPKGVIKERGRFTGEYDIRISYVDGVWFIEYVFSGLFFEDVEPTYPDIFSGDTLEEAVNNASNFFDVNFGKYKLIG